MNNTVKSVDNSFIDEFRWRMKEGFKSWIFFKFNRRTDSRDAALWEVWKAAYMEQLECCICREPVPGEYD